MDEHVRGNRPPRRGELRRVESKEIEHAGGPEQRELQEIHTDVRRYQPLNGWRHSRLRWRFVHGVRHVVSRCVSLRFYPVTPYTTCAASVPLADIAMISHSSEKLIPAAAAPCGIRL